MVINMALPAAGIRTTFRRKSAIFRVVSPLKPCTIDRMVVAKADTAVIQNLDRQMPIAEMPRQCRRPVGGAIDVHNIASDAAIKIQLRLPRPGRRPPSVALPAVE